MADLHDAPLASLDAVLAYRLLALRAAVFVVEQECAYLDADGRDLEAGAVQLWIEADGEVIATTRLLWDAPGRARIGRVATAAAHRRRGHAEALLRHALHLAGAAEVVLDAQSYLQGWYERFGFAVTGPEFLDDGIAHVPMARAAGQDGDGADLSGSSGH
ncbi:MAG: GNAT family N-acetyltransferase [Jatrophihabitans sp.]|nr:MAG: GNAT family N-acetyltransferase [Jatrophihabitans sp.]